MNTLSFFCSFSKLAGFPQNLLTFVQGTRHLDLCIYVLVFQEMGQLQKRRRKKGIKIQNKRLPIMRKTANKFKKALG